MRTRGGATIEVIKPPSPATLTLLSAFEEAAATTRPTSPCDNDGDDNNTSTWKCSQCTCSNDTTNKRCTICNGRRPATKTSSKRKRKRKRSSSSTSSSSKPSTIPTASKKASKKVNQKVTKKTTQQPKQSKPQKKRQRTKNVKVIASPSVSPKTSKTRAMSYDVEDETEAQIAREELSKKLLGMTGNPRTAPASAVKATVSVDDVDDGDGEYALVGLKISIKGRNKRWKKCNVLRVHGEISGQAIVQWVTSGQEEVVRLFGKGKLEFRV